jgi:uncharacterized alpha-E superfamily protein
MLSRVADNLFWMSRYLERAEHIARIVLVHHNLELEQAEEANAGRWRRVFQSLSLEPPVEGAANSVLSQICFGMENRCSITTSIEAARNNARQVREQISSEMWEQLNRLYHAVRHSDHEDHNEEIEEFLVAVKDGAHLFHGLSDSTMSHGEGWQFIQLGQSLERAINTAALLEVHYREFYQEASFDAEWGPDAAGYLEWIGLLKCATAFEAYCKVHTAAIDPLSVVEFLLLDEQFPHSIRFVVDTLQASLEAIGRLSPGRRVNRVQRIAGRLQAELNFTQIEEVMDRGIANTMQHIRESCYEIHNCVHEAFVSYPIESALEV